MEPGSCGAQRRAVATAALLVGACALLGVSTPGAAAASQGATPNLVTGSAYLVAPANLIDGHYYESFPGTADFGLTIDGALALAATGDDNAALRKIVAFIDDRGEDPSGDTVDDWTGIGTSYASGGAIGKEALLAEVVGLNPRNFGGHNLIAALDASVCTRASGGADPTCPAAGSYLNDTSVFDQALGVMAQFRAGQAGQAAAPVAYLESLQSANGSFPSLIPPSGGPDVDSTAMAVMALALAPGARAAADVAAGITWIAGRQEHNGGFPSEGAESINSTGLAIQAMTLRAGVYGARISAALAFLAGQQNSNGGFNVDAGQSGSNLRASTQAVGGAAGTSFGTLRTDLASPAPATSHPSPHPSDTGHQAGNPGRQGSSAGRGSGSAADRHPKPADSHRARSRQPVAPRQPASGSAKRPALAQLRSASAQGARGASQALVVAIAIAVAVAIAAGALLLRQRLSRRHRPADTPAAPDPSAAPDSADSHAESAAPDQVSS
jgi:hypothetical protein